MENVNKTINNWLDELDNFKYPSYESLPDIDLYMEQLIMYLDRELKVFKTSSLDKVITPFMINNYVKGEIISAPITKKYNREHIAQINETCSLKQVLTVSEIKQILDVEYENKENYEAFNEFKHLTEEKLEEAIKETKEALSNISDNDINSLTNLSLKLAIQANAYITLSKRMLFYIKKYKDMKDIKEELKK